MYATVTCVHERLAQVGIEYTYGQLCMCKGVELKFRRQHFGYDRLQHECSASCYRPAVFFRHTFLIALSFPHGKIRRVFNTLYFLITELHMFEMTLSRIV